MGCVASAEEVEVKKDEGSDGWQAYIDTQLVGMGCGEALILGTTGELWAKSPGIALKKYDAKVTADDGAVNTIGVNEAADVVQFAKTGVKPEAGLRVNGVKYVVLKVSRAEGSDDLPFVCYARQGKEGVCLAMANKSVVVGYYNEDDKKQRTVAGQCNTAVEKLAKYLLDQGY